MARAHTMCLAEAWCLALSFAPRAASRSSCCRMPVLSLTAARAWKATSASARGLHPAQEWIAVRNHRFRRPAGPRPPSSRCIVQGPASSKLYTRHAWAAVELVGRSKNWKACALRFSPGRWSFSVSTAQRPTQWHHACRELAAHACASHLAASSGHTKRAAEAVTDPHPRILGA
jgi:hypothetical protein